jgi:hypothetical protein
MFDWLGETDMTTSINHFWQTPEVMEQNCHLFKNVATLFGKLMVDGISVTVIKNNKICEQGCKYGPD